MGGKIGFRLNTRLRQTRHYIKLIYSTKIIYTLRNKKKASNMKRKIRDIALQLFGFKTAESRQHLLFRI